MYHDNSDMASPALISKDAHTIMVTLVSPFFFVLVYLLHQVQLIGLSHTL